MTVSTIGTGPIHVVALHGWFGTGSSWLPTVNWLDPGAYTIAIPDHRGYGSRIDDPGEYTVAEIASDAIAVADELGWRGFDIVGHSMGGKAAQLVAAKAPERVRRVVAVTPVPPAPLPFDDDTRALFRAAAGDLTTRAAIIGNSTADRHSSRFVDMIVEESRLSRTEAFAAYFESWAGDDITAAVNGLPTPVSVIAGEHDNALNAEVLQEAILPFYPNAELLVMAAAGHYPLFETPVALASVIDTFLSQPAQEV